MRRTFAFTISTRCIRVCKMAAIQKALLRMLFQLELLTLLNLERDFDTGLVHERKREREREGGKERERERESWEKKEEERRRTVWLAVCCCQPHSEYNWR